MAGHPTLFDEKVERILPEVERQVKSRHRSVAGIREAYKCRARERLHLTVVLGAGRSFPYSLNSRHVMEENIGEIVTSIVWAAAHVEQVI